MFSSRFFSCWVPVCCLFSLIPLIINSSLIRFPFFFYTVTAIAVANIPQSNTSWVKRKPVREKEIFFFLSGSCVCFPCLAFLIPVFRKFHYFILVFSPLVCLPYLDPLFGSHISFPCLIPVFGPIIWFPCLVLILVSLFSPLVLVTVFGSHVCFPCVFF